VCVVEDGGKLVGTLSLADLVRADERQKVTEAIDSSTPSVALEADVPEVARLMSDYNLIAMPVVDGDCRPVGIIAVDDILELLVPEEWRRRAGAARD
jgi:Mg/Co/Ni transporter MgtE